MFSLEAGMEGIDVLVQVHLLHIAHLGLFFLVNVFSGMHIEAHFVLVDLSALIILLLVSALVVFRLSAAALIF